jgi:methyltransferase (TIGR00027 family)
MREDWPSATASAVAFARGVATLPARRSAPSPDPVAAELLHPALGGLLRWLKPLARRSSAVAWALRAGSLGLVDHVALRTAAIDEALREACEGGVDQVVILGAGLDARAWRLAALGDAVVFEVDHPATQRFKRSRVGALDRHAREVRFVAVDFERQGLGERLADEGHDAGRRTFWIWEGVVMYLPTGAVRSSLEAIRDRSAPGSRLAVTYGTRDDQLWLDRFAHTVDLGFQLLGEPLVGLTTREAFHDLLAAAGWRTLDDTGPRDWRTKYGFGGLLTIEERLVLAEAGSDRAPGVAY